MPTGIGDVVKLAAPLPYHDALAEMSQVDGLLLLQRNQQIPAEPHEYLRAQRPILALTHAAIRRGHDSDAGRCNLRFSQTSS